MMFAGFARADAIVRIDPAPAWRHAESITELAEVFDTWLDQNTNFQRPEI